MDLKIRNYHPSDLPALYRICLKTGDSGKDASNIYENPDLLGHIYAGPYAVFEPDLCFVATGSGKPVGYILGTRDSEKFYKKCEKEWFPFVRTQYPFSDVNENTQQSKILKKLHQPFKADVELKDYPAHLHIDLLPEAQGQGLGKKLMYAFINNLKEIEVKGLHLGVGKKNQNAIKFYEHFGFFKFKESEYAIIFAIDL